MKWTLAAAFVGLLSLGFANQSLAQGQYYSRTASRDPVTGRQVIVDFNRPRWQRGGLGGVSFDAGSGSIQSLAVGRERLTGRLQFYSQYNNAWSGASYGTATVYNPFTRRYETLHQFAAAAAGADRRGAGRPKPGERGRGAAGDRPPAGDQCSSGGNSRRSRGAAQPAVAARRGAKRANEKRRLPPARTKAAVDSLT